MQIKLLATGQGPDYYTFSGETVTAYQDGVAETYDLSGFPEGGVFQEADSVNGIPAIRTVTRTNGVLQVTLCQAVGPGHWAESGVFPATAYDPDAIHVVFDDTQSYTGEPWARTRQGKTLINQPVEEEAV